MIKKSGFEPVRGDYCPYFSFLKPIDVYSVGHVDYCCSVESCVVRNYYFVVLKSPFKTSGSDYILECY